MNLLASAWATCMFELKRSMTAQRLAVAAVLTLFPPVMLLVSLGSAPPLFFLILLVALVTVLSLLLWATPIVYSEIESKGWVFLASRPRGRISIYLGKYMAAVLYTATITTTAIFLSVMIAQQSFENPLLTFVKLAVVFLLASAGYGAVFAFIGTIVFKRAMVIAAGFMLIWEGVIASLPAIVNLLTLRWHLQSVAIEWVGFFATDGEFGEAEYRQMYNQGPEIWVNLPAILLAIVVFIGLGCYVITSREYNISDEV